ncbi:TetR/AcrR family transcriptional regulator [Arthrobacter gengyunqii]|uniref:TetR/AcrR family transcriptional regulator n=1 Tax=Arthrobacter gengyunqii TaxID=2886940 RepID=A0A9X1M2Q6_9MICC|nr:TetR/AcrR family transcriptional regulator [Arthrobacter gengyunqii]MCC3269745.1 TetR/AcrR family transcriptional regulator [Arthrobacter gengyunqii]UOY97200.1 TetR/AcrR family transcriptional regulator [Arthrobacter gengyunqii]
MPRQSGTKRAILDAALELAADNGITGTTMENVAERAGVAKGSVYYNFTSKDGLFEELLLEGVGVLAETVRNARSSQTGWPALQSMVRALLETVADNRALARLLAAEIFRTDRAWQHSLELLRREVLGEFIIPIRETSPPAEMDGRLEVVAGSVFGAALIGGLEWLVFSPERSLDEVTESVLYAISGQLASRA